MSADGSPKSDAQSSKKSTGSLLPAASPVQRAGADPATLFRAMVTRKFGTPTRAWRILDCQKQAALTKKEFSSSLRVTGYGGCAGVLWDALGCASLISLKDIDPASFQLLANFRNTCAKRLKGLDKVFMDKSGELTGRLEFEAFTQICQKIKVPRPWDPIFDLLDVKCVGSITWEDAKFLKENYKWSKGNATVVRKAATALGGTRNFCTTERTSGTGHMGLSMKPRNVFLPKSNSLPDINPKLRPHWNERHTIFDTRDNSTDQSLHLMKYVKCEDEIRISRRCEKKMLEVPNEQWLSENMHLLSEDYGEDDDEDDGWAAETY